MMILSDNVYLFTPKDDKTNFNIVFQVPQGYDQLRCECSFTPKVVRDLELNRQVIAANIGKYIPRDMLVHYQMEQFSLVNHLTFSLDYENLYIGCAHRHAAKSVHIISADGSSPGFVRQKAEAGTWRAVINIHSITSPRVEYNLKISALKQEGHLDGI